MKSEPKRRGRPPRIDQAQIVAAARALAPGTLTMQSVADALGVDRTTLHYYVGDRDGLLELVVTDLFETELREIELPDDGRWQDFLRAHANAVHRGVLKVGATNTHFRLRLDAGLAITERVLEALTSTGFTADEAGRILTLTSGIAYSAAHDQLGTEQSKLRQTPELVRALNERPADDFPLLNEIVANRTDATAAARDFAFGLDVVIAGLEATLVEHRR